MRSISRLSSMFLALLCLTAAAPAQDTEPVVTLLDAGNGAKAVLRYDIAPETKQISRMTMKLTAKQTMNGMEMPSREIPAMTTPTRFHAIEKVSDGVRFEMVMDSVEVEGAGTPAEAGGTKMTGVMTTRGELLDLEITLPDGTDPDLGAQLTQNAHTMRRQMSMPFPEEAIADGAKWTVEFDATAANGMMTTLTATCTLRERNADTVILDVSMEQHADPQKITSPQMPGQEIDLQEFSGSGEGTMTINLSRPMATDSSMKTESKMRVGVEQMGQKMQIEVESDVDMTVESEDETTTP